MKKHKIFLRLLSFVLILASLFVWIPVEADATGLVEELFDISFYYFHSIGENGREKTESFYNWGSADKEKNGIKIEKTSAGTVQVVIDADANELYTNCKPVLLWMHKADSLFDTTKYTDIDKWYSNKLEETFLLCEIPDYTQDCTIKVDVPIKLNIGLTGLLNGGYYEIEFYSEDAIPQQLDFAYRCQTYTLEELEQYMKYDMNDAVAEYYNVDCGFRANKDGLPFRNTDYAPNGGFCAGISALTTTKFNGTKIVESYKIDDKKTTPTVEYTWYNYVYGNEKIHDIVLNDTNIINKNSPSQNMEKDGIATAYPMQYFSKSDANDKAFYDLLSYYHLENNKASLLGGNSYIGNVKLSNLENRWSIIDYVASYLRQGNAVIVNLSAKGKGGHAIVGYKMEQIDEDTYRLYCYDSNRPDDMALRYKGDVKNEDLDENGAYKNIVWSSCETYIDLTKKTIVGQRNFGSQREFDVFEFDSSHTSFSTNSKNGAISFSLSKGDSVGVFNYGSESNEVIAYKAFPVKESDNTVQIRTFAFYKSGEVTEITNSVNTTIKMDYDFIGWYKVKDSKITLTKSGYSFTDSSSRYIECYVTYDNHTDSYGQIQVRIPIVQGG
jgi:hypothetical protein